MCKEDWTHGSNHQSSTLTNSEPTTSSEFITFYCTVSLHIYWRVRNVCIRTQEKSKRSLFMGKIWQDWGRRERSKIQFFLSWAEKMYSDRQKEATGSPFIAERHITLTMLYLRIGSPTHTHEELFHYTVIHHPQTCIRRRNSNVCFAPRVDTAKNSTSNPRAKQVRHLIERKVIKSDNRE